MIVLPPVTAVLVATEATNHLLLDKRPETHLEDSRTSSLGRFIPASSMRESREAAETTNEPCSPGGPTQNKTKKKRDGEPCPHDSFVIGSFCFQNWVEIAICLLPCVRPMTSKGRVDTMMAIPCTGADLSFDDSDRFDSRCVTPSLCLSLSLSLSLS